MLTETISVGIDIYQITSAHEAEIRNRGMAFISNALPTLVAAPPAERPRVASGFDNAERSIRIDKTAAAANLPDGDRHDRASRRILEALREGNFAVASVVIADHTKPIGPDNAGVFASTSLTGSDEEDRARAIYLSRQAHIGVMSVRMENETDWYNFYVLLAPLDFWTVLVARSFDSVIAFVLVVGLAIVIRRVMRPLGSLTASAERLGRGESVDAIPVAGSADVRTTIEAFNRMGARIKQTLDYQTSLLGSLGHDLKGPLAGARRATEGLHPEEARDKALKRLQQADDIVAAVATYARDTRRDGETAPIDLASLLLTVADEQLDAGHDVTFEPGIRVIVVGRHVALTRAFRNLVENGIKYGKRVDLSLVCDDAWAIVHVDDEGPGIEPAQIEAAFRPFERLGAGGPGSGLGLAIVRTIVVDHGGTVSLQRRDGSGLRATVSLPLQKAGQPDRNT